MLRADLESFDPSGSNSTGTWAYWGVGSARLR
jgi:hypothetical protein